MLLTYFLTPVEYIQPGPSGQNNGWRHALPYKCHSACSIDLMGLKYIDSIEEEIVDHSLYDL